MLSYCINKILRVLVGDPTHDQDDDIIWYPEGVHICIFKMAGKHMKQHMMFRRAMPFVERNMSSAKGEHDWTWKNSGSTHCISRHLNTNPLFTVRAYGVLRDPRGTEEMNGTPRPQTRHPWHIVRKHEKTRYNSVTFYHHVQTNINISIISIANLVPDFTHLQDLNC